MFLSKMSEKTVKLIGLTGGIGAGKSTVIDILKKHHMIVFDCDHINRQLLKIGEKGYLAIVQYFGASFLKEDQSIDIKKMGDAMFTNEQCKKKIEALLHPLILMEIKKKIDTFKTDKIVVEVPLLFEIGWEHHFDEIWVVACDQEKRLQRLAKYRYIDAKEAKRRMSHQLPQQIKIDKADHVLYNDTNKEDLEAQIVTLLEKRM